MAKNRASEHAPDGLGSDQTVNSGVGTRTSLGMDYSLDTVTPGTQLF